MSDELNEKWLSLKALVTDLEVDVLKAVKGNNAAAVRTRKGLRQVKTLASDLIKSSKVKKAEKEPWALFQPFKKAEKEPKTKE